MHLEPFDTCFCGSEDVRGNEEILQKDVGLKKMYDRLLEDLEGYFFILMIC